MGFERRWISTSRRSDGVSAAVHGFGRGQTTLRLQLYFARAVAAQLPGERCDVLLGDGEDAGCVLLRFGPEGSTKVIQRAATDATHSQGNTTLRFAPPPCVPAGYTFRSEPCPHEWRSPTELRVQLPVETWKSYLKESTDD